MRDNVIARRPTHCEAHLILIENRKGTSYATQVAWELKARTWQGTDLTTLAGISFQEFFNKMASDQNKPMGQFVITPETAPAFLEALPIGNLMGLG